MNRRTDYEAIASSFDRRYQGREWEYAGVEAALLAFLGTARDRAILEVGCGTGHWLKLLYDQGWHVQGLDASPGMTRQARRLVPQVEVVDGRAERLSWKDSVFDRVFCINAFHHFDGKQMFLDEARRVLRPGGGLFTVGLDPHAGLDRWWVYEFFEGVLALDRERYASAPRIRTWMSERGFMECHTTEVQLSHSKMSFREALSKRLIDKNAMSQLAILTETEYQTGLETMAQVNEDLER